MAGLSGSLTKAPGKGRILRFLTEKVIALQTCESYQKLKVEGGHTTGNMTPPTTF